MMRFSPLNHLCAIIVACLVVFIIQPQKKIDIKPLIPQNVQDDLLNDYTPYYPGQKNLYQHEICSPRFAEKKKIVILGPSVADSIGCDYTWELAKLNNPHHDELAVEFHSQPNGVAQIYNVHHTCSIAGQMNLLLKSKGLDDWRAFDLACDASRLNTMLLTYARIAELKPEIVIFSDGFPYAETKNAGAADVGAALYAYMDYIYDNNPATQNIWRSYRNHLTKMGQNTDWAIPTSEKPFDPNQQPSFYRQKVSLNDVLVEAIGSLHNARLLDVQPLPVHYDPSWRPWAGLDPSHVIKEYPDIGYFQGFKLLKEAQAEHNGKFLLVYSPLYDQRQNTAYLDLVKTGIYAQYLQKNQIPYLVLSDLPLKPIYETYDGFHHTVYGNRRLAAIFMHELEDRGFIP